MNKHVMKDYVGSRLTIEDSTYEVVATHYMGGDLMLTLEEVETSHQIPMRATLRLQDTEDALCFK